MLPPPPTRIGFIGKGCLAVSPGGGGNDEREEPLLASPLPCHAGGRREPWPPAACGTRLLA